MSFSASLLRAFAMHLDANTVNIGDLEEVLEGAFFASSSMADQMTVAELVEARSELDRFLKEWDTKTLVEIERATSAPFTEFGHAETLRQAINVIVDELGHELAVREQGPR